MHTQKPIELVSARLEQFSATYDAAVSGLESECANLENESQGLLKAAEDLRLVIPAQAREAQREADALLLAGKCKEAEARYAEQQRAEAAPSVMEKRRGAIAARLEAIQDEKRTIGRRIFKEWFPGLRAVLLEDQRELVEAMDSAWEGVLKIAALLPTLPGGQSAVISENLRNDLWARDSGEEKILFRNLRAWFGA
ncbi:hypothetical protein [Terracidiphilus sp.]|uniref:hypothetical protein n=1 Tax=Terracidiphilus sp. TaxID=1964191 RepID=UPI003C23CE33